MYAAYLRVSVGMPHVLWLPTAISSTGGYKIPYYMHMASQQDLHVSQHAERMAQELFTGGP